MACSSCGTGGCGSTGGCQNKGLCASGSCNKMNAYDWISALDYDDPSAYEYVEVSFKNGARKEFFKNPNHLCTGDTVLTEVQGGGFDIGVISLSGELVRSQMKKKYTTEDRITLSIIRRANERDLEKLENKTKLEYDAMILSRAIARTLGLDIKIGDVEYQGDMKKATFFFTANGRVDFRELVRAYAKEFKVKIEMRQIGSRQESARIGGIGSCGRELCCSTWLSDFRSVNTTVARYQNIAINQTKLSGQCGRLKCCLNYELDTYMDALQHFPTHANLIKTKKGNASLVKTDIFKGLMFYVYEDISMRGVFHPLDKEKVKEILALNKKGILPEDLTSFTELKDEQKEIGFADVTGEIELPNKKKKKKKKSPSNKKEIGNNLADDETNSAGPKPNPKPNPQKQNNVARNQEHKNAGQKNRPQENSNKTVKPNLEENIADANSTSGKPVQENRNNFKPRPNIGGKNQKPQHKGPQAQVDNTKQQTPREIVKPQNNPNENKPLGEQTSDNSDNNPNLASPTDKPNENRNFKKKKFFNKKKKDN
ncbi:MAG: hypothetical protein RLZZ546_341 [Bacteroidota bacterium]|jgi:cell fate regulator YaaT (PSP1 superfamily)